MASEPRDELLATPHLISGYRLEERIGQGAMGAVYRAHQVSLDRRVAIKVLLPHFARKPEVVRLFLREARILAKLVHPNIVMAYDSGAQGGIYYFAMEFVDGPTLAEIVQRGGAIEQRRAARLFLEAARALEHAHFHRLVHRDIKPANLMLTGSGTLKLCDLGFALVRTTLGEVDEGALGTPAYLSPEQARGEAAVDIRSDLYALGASFYHILSGRPPFAGGTAAEIMAKHCAEPLTPLRRARFDITPALSQVVDRLLEKDPSRRYASPALLVQAMQEIVQAFERGDLAMRMAEPAVSASRPTSRKTDPNAETVVEMDASDLPEIKDPAPARPTAPSTPRSVRPAPDSSRPPSSRRTSALRRLRRR
ncbi:MAG: serine/threonine protein kinase [Planctomycetes bacterium]|nr:serine/threonine protein kinase [Planctomycetota bacterium]